MLPAVYPSAFASVEPLEPRRLLSTVTYDLNATVARLRENGARILNEPRAGAGGHIYVFIHPASTGGVLLELIQEHQ